MQRYRYKASSASGQIVEGEYSANSEEQIVEWLYQQGLTPIEIVVEQEDFPKRSSKKKEKSLKISRQNILEFTKSVSDLLKSGFAIDKALLTMSRLMDDKSTAKVLSERILTHLEEGKTLSVSLKKTSAQFSDLYLSLVQAGEQSGQLKQIFNRLASHLQEEKEFRQNLRGVLIYPILIFVVSIVSIGILFGFVIPRFAVIFKDLNQEIPPLTKLMIALSEWGTHYWYIGLLTGAAAIGAVILAARIPKCVYLTHKWALKVPILGRSLWQKAIMVRWASSLSLLLSSGEKLIEALYYAQKTLGNIYLEEQMSGVIEKVRKGQPLHLSMASTGAFLPLVTHMLALGEESGELGSSLNHLSTTFEEDVRSIIKTIMSMIAPVLILVMGLVIALIIGSMLLPLMSMTDLAEF